MFQGVAWTICNSSGKIFVGIDYPGDRFRATRIRPISRRAQRPGSVVSPEVRFPPFSFFRRSGRGGRTSGCRLRTGAGGPVRPFGAILPTSLRSWAPSAHEAADGHAVRRPLPLRLLCPPCAAPVPCVPKLGTHGALFRGFRSLRPIVRDAKHANSCKLADNDLHLRKEEKEMILALFMIVLAVLFFRG